MEQRGFKCSVQEGIYDGEVTVWVDAAEVERLGDDAVIAAAKPAWRRQSGPDVPLGYYNVKVVLIEELEMSPLVT